MTNHYFLIDYENVQPTLSRRNVRSSKVFVFLGVHQSKMHVDRVRLLQPLGERVEYVQIESSGQNALDFHIAFYVGELSAKAPGGTLHVISKDKGFYCLVRHVKGKGFRVKRCTDVPAPAASSANAHAPSELDRIDIVIENLRSRKTGRPRTRRT